MATEALQHVTPQATLQDFYLWRETLAADTLTNSVNELWKNTQTKMLFMAFVSVGVVAFLVCIYIEYIAW